jgi:hypothetical protein
VVCLTHSELSPLGHAEIGKRQASVAGDGCGSVREKFLRRYATVWAIDCQTDARDRGSGRFVTHVGGFRPVVFNPAETANRGDLSAIFASNRTREHVARTLSTRISDNSLIAKAIVQNLCQNRPRGTFSQWSFARRLSNRAGWKRPLDERCLSRSPGNSATECVDVSVGAVAIEEVGG